ncbi:MAG: hypothetical protein COA58_02590 [Bacteroidetes bacterium]|nr:MAG: hypothetical protein COA58_02590 [Bacteroidota bacterium]
MKNTLKTLLIATLIISLSACKDDESTPEPPAVNFLFADPISEKAYGFGDTVHINGVITFDNELHGYELNIHSEHFDSTVHTVHNHEDGKTIHVHSHWVNDLTHHTDMTLTIDALTDHDGTKGTKVIHFHCHPM